ncbi:hypothetical protein D9M68_973920 [compost metagenome]
MLALDGLQHVQPVEPGHGDVEQHEIESLAAVEGPHHVEHLGTGLRLGHHLNVGRVCQDLLEPLAHDAVVVTDQHADGFGHQVELRVQTRSPGGSITVRPMRVPCPGALSM